MSERCKSAILKKKQLTKYVKPILRRTVVLHDFIIKHEQDTNKSKAGSGKPRAIVYKQKECA